MEKKYLLFMTIFACLASKIIDVRNYTNSLVNADWFYAKFTNTTFQKIPIPHLTHTIKTEIPSLMWIFKNSLSPDST